MPQHLDPDSKPVRDAYARRVRDRDRLSSVDLTDERRISRIIQFLGEIAQEQTDYETIRADMIEPVVLAYGYEEGLGFNEQMRALLTEKVTPFEIAFFLRNYDAVIGRVSETFDPDGYDFVDKVWDVITDQGKAQIQQQRRVLVACRDANGIPAFYAAVVNKTDEMVKAGKHYAAAQKQARADGYELPDGDVICIDTQDARMQGIEETFNQFFELTATVEETGMLL